MTISPSNKVRPARWPPILVVSAVDSSGGAGLAQDVRAANALGHPVRCAASALTVQDDTGVSGRSPAPPGVCAKSIQSAFLTLPKPCAVKVGALICGQAVREAAFALAPAFRAGVPIVVDPVVRASSGGGLLDRDGLRRLVRDLVPMCRVVTPNRAELRFLSATLGGHRSSELRAVRYLLECGAGSVLVTGGTARGVQCVDRLYLPGGPPVPFRHPRIAGPPARGTGCCLSTAIACFLARGLDVREACARAVSWTVGRIRRSVMVGRQRMLFP